MQRISTVRGVSLIEVIVGVSVMVMVFGAFFASFSSLFELTERNRIRTDALFLANERIEMLRALPYDSVGTVGGIPSGSMPQNETIVYDNNSFNRRTFIQYVDDPADGIDAADTLTADYKRIKVEVSTDFRHVTQTFSMVTTVAPRSQESLIGAGVLRINVIDADNDPLIAATVHILNTTVATSVDITTFTNVNGTVSFPGAWAGPGYEVTVGKAGYSSAQTYTATVANPNPSPSPLTVAANSTTEVYFKIDRLSTIALFARHWPVRQRFIDTFDDASQLATTSAIQVTGGSLSLAGGSGSYPTYGTTSSVTIAPASLGQWLMFYAEGSTPPATAVHYRIQYDAGGGVFEPIPDTDLPGNAAGFITTPIDLGGLDPSTYTALRINAVLESHDVLVTPTVTMWKLSYDETDVPDVGVSISLEGSKTIGSDAGGQQIHKYSATHATDALGTITLTDMEFDQYAVTVAGKTVAEECPSLPLVLEPDTTYQQTLTLEPTTVNSYQVRVLNPFGGSVARAEVHLESATTDVTRSTGPCGIAYFGGLAADTYTVSVLAAGFASSTVSRAVSGATTDSITLSL
jgi:hypothetical protein